MQSSAAEVAKILTPNEEILYVALQNWTSMSAWKDSVVATSNRLILHRSHAFGRVDFSDLPWQDVKNVSIEQGVLSTDLTVETTGGRKSSPGSRRTRRSGSTGSARNWSKSGGRSGGCGR